MCNADTKILDETKQYIQKCIENLKYKHHEKFFINIYKKFYTYIQSSNMKCPENPNYIDIKSEKTISNIKHIIDWFNSEGMSNYKSHGIQSIDNAYQLANNWFKSNIQKYSENGSYDYNVVYIFEDGYYWVQLLTPEALDYESKYMQHCIGGGIMII